MAVDTLKETHMRVARVRSNLGGARGELIQILDEGGLKRCERRSLEKTLAVLDAADDRICPALASFAKRRRLP